MSRFPWFLLRAGAHRRMWRAWWFKDVPPWQYIADVMAVKAVARRLKGAG